MSDGRPTGEWIEADGLGGFASGTADGIRTRRYHALLLAATTPPTGRVVLVNDLDVWLDTPNGAVALSSHRYAPDVIHPDGVARLERFTADPWPCWISRLPGGARIAYELLVAPGTPAVIATWRLLDPLPGARLRVRPLLSGRDHHALHRENPGFRFEATIEPGCVTWRPYAGLPAVVARTAGRYVHAPDWYRRFLYAAEAERGLDCVEDLGSPGAFEWALDDGEASLCLTAGAAAPLDPSRVREAERARRAAFPSRLHRAADAYLVRRGGGRSIIAGYPWFTDWGRDTCIAVRGLCLATGRIADARLVLLQWAAAESDGMLPNRFPDDGAAPEYGSADAALWFAVAVHELCAHDDVPDDERRILRDAVERIVTAYARGTRHGIRMDGDGLLAAGQPGDQLTWMDARVDGRPITPRIGKPVELQALWVNALRSAGAASPRWLALAERAAAAFVDRFWHEAGGALHDVVDVDHRPGVVDASVRPNQILAVGGLPYRLLGGDRARRVVDQVERRLWTPLGLRTLAPDDPAYRGRYAGDGAARDAVYHQGTAWPWLLGPFIDAWVAVRGGAPEAIAEAGRRFLAPLLAHLDQAGLGHVSEIADGDAPHTPRGCPFQAWSVGEALRVAGTLRDARCTSVPAC